MFSFVSRNIITGLVTILPVLLTLYLLYWFAVSTESALKNLIVWIIPQENYHTGMGIVVGFIGAFLVGLLMRAYFIQQLFSLGEALLMKMPLVKSLYGAMRDFFSYFSPSEKKEFDQVVAVTIDNKQIIGLVTQDDPDKMPSGINKQSGANSELMVVYIPMSYMIGGFTLFIPREQITVLDMTVEDAMKFALSAGITANASQNK